MWIIQYTVSRGDYLAAYVPDHPKADKNGYVAHHRVVAENKLGRLLRDGEEVHHKNRDRKDNSEDNLEVMPGVEHRKLHARERYPNGRSMTNLICSYCKKLFSRETRRVNDGIARGQEDFYCCRSHASFAFGCGRPKNKSLGS